MLRLTTLSLICAVLAVACAVPEPATEEGEAPAAEGAVVGNPPAEGFNEAASDVKAIEIADRVMESMGGRAAWDGTRYLAWRFFAPQPEGRTHIWDRYRGWVRFEQGDQLTMIDINTREGMSFKDGLQITNAAELEEALKAAYEAWINDSYWLLMPYKLKDSGVTLTYVGEGETQEGRAADVLQLTFQDVGVTPDNKYHVWVDKERGMVEQWAYYANYNDEEPGFITPWADWSQHGDIMLSGDRGQVSLTEIAVLAEVPDSVFTSPDPVDMATLPRR